jgi:hypothetical protein
MREGRGACTVLMGNVMETDHLKDLGLDGGNIIKVDLQVTGRVGRNVDRIDLVQDRGRWLAVVNKVLKLWVP